MNLTSKDFWAEHGSEKKVKVIVKRQRKLSNLLRTEVETLNLPEMNPPEGQGQGEPGAQGLRLIIQACQRLYPQQPNPLQVLSKTLFSSLLSCK